MPDYRPTYTKEENDLLPVRAMVAAIISSQGVETKLAVAEAFKLVDEVHVMTNARIEARVTKEERRQRGY